MFFVLGTGLAIAEPDRSAADGEKSHAIHEFIRKADSDGDGRVSRAEFEALERIARLPEDKRAQLFKRLDKDGDEAIHPDELPKSRRNHPDRQRFPLMEKLDQNGDDQVSMEEFLAGPLAKRVPEERLRALFARLDRDGDGVLTAADQRGGGEPGGREQGRQRIFAKLDRDQDGFLDYNEFSQAPWHRKLDQGQLKRRWGKLDSNRDGKISGQEFSAAGHAGPRDKRRGKPDQSDK